MNNAEHCKHDQSLFGLSIVHLIEDEILKIAEKEWEHDKESPPMFWVSLNNEDMDNQSLMITIEHCGIKFTEKLFPRDETQYGYDSVLDQMINMYNQTM